MDQRLQQRLADAAARPAGNPVELPVRKLLGWWGYRRRDFDIVAEIQDDLETAGLATEPPFDTAPGNETVRLVPPRAREQETQAEPRGEEPTEDADAVEDETSMPASLRVGDLPAAIGDVCSISQEDTLEKAQGLMTKHGYSQLAVLSDSRVLRGAVSWESIACALIGNRKITLANTIDKHPEIVYASEELFKQLPGIVRSGFAFVQDGDHKVCGIVTAADLSRQFENLAGPYFQVGEAERRLRRRVDQRLSSEDIKAVNRNANSARDLTLGNYVYLLRDPERWRKLDWTVDGVDFVDELDQVRRTRNAIMHFDGEPLGEDRVNQLTRFVQWLRRLDPNP